MSGRDFLGAMAVGCDLTCRLSRALGPTLSERGWYPAVARRRLRRDRGGGESAPPRRAPDARRVLARPRTTRQPRADLREQRHGDARRSRCVPRARGSRLRAAREGGAPRLRPPVRRSRRAPSTPTPAVTPTSCGVLTIWVETYAGERVSFKPWPSCRATHPFVEAALALRAEHGSRAGSRSQVCGSSARPEAGALVAEPRELKLRPGHGGRGEVQRLRHRGARAGGRRARPRLLRPGRRHLG